MIQSLAAKIQKNRPMSPCQSYLYGKQKQQNLFKYLISINMQL